MLLFSIQESLLMCRKPIRNLVFLAVVVLFVSSSEVNASPDFPRALGSISPNPLFLILAIISLPFWLIGEIFRSLFGGS